MDFIYLFFFFEKNRSVQLGNKIMKIMTTLEKIVFFVANKICILNSGFTMRGF